MHTRKRLAAAVLLLLAAVSCIGARSATVVVQADEAWQATGVEAMAGETVVIEVTEGSWTRWLGTAPHNGGEGSNYTCASVVEASLCVEPLPDYPAGALIGRIGSSVFGVGTSATITARDDGEVFLRMNDDDQALDDNEGALTVEVTVE